MKMFAFSRLLAAMAVATGAALALGACSRASSTPAPAGGAPPPSGARPAAGLPPSSSQQVGISVNGAGAVTAVPDVALFRFSVEVRADTVVAARDQAAVAMDAVLARLKALGIADRDIQTTALQVQPIYAQEEAPVRGPRPTTPKIVGYQVTNAAQAKVRRLESVGTVVDDAVKAGGDAIRISGISFSLDNPKPLEGQARDLAVRDAIAKAQQIAGLAGAKLGAPISIIEQSAFPLVQRGSFAAPSAAFAQDVRTPIAAGELEVRVDIHVVFGIS